MATRVEVAKEASARIGGQRSRVELDINPVTSGSRGTIAFPRSTTAA